LTRSGASVFAGAGCREPSPVTHSINRHPVHGQTQSE
jgi:hypothetical protein